MVQGRPVRLREERVREEDAEIEETIYFVGNRWKTRFA